MRNPLSSSMVNQKAYTSRPQGSNLFQGDSQMVAYVSQYSSILHYEAYALVPQGSQMLYLAYAWNLFWGNSQMAAHVSHHFLPHSHK